MKLKNKANSSIPDPRSLSVADKEHVLSIQQKRAGGWPVQQPQALLGLADEAEARVDGPVPAPDQEARDPVELLHNDRPGRAQALALHLGDELGGKAPALLALRVALAIVLATGGAGQLYAMWHSTSMKFSKVTPP